MKFKFRYVCLLVASFIILLKMITQKSLPGLLESYTTTTEKLVPCAPEGKHDQFEPCLIEYVKLNLLLPPSGLPLKLPRYPSYDKQPAIQEKMEFIERHFIRKMENPSSGFFIECGANDGEFISPTLGLEIKYNWTGLLIEANPRPFRKLLRIHRNTWAMNAALSIATYSSTSKFYTGNRFSAMGGFKKAGTITINVTCIPLFTVLAALNMTTVDYLSLDVEGTDLDIMKTVPFDKVIFKVITLEHAHVTGFQNATVEFLEGHGYKFIGTLLDYYTQDSLFVHESAYTPDMALKIKFQQV